MEVFIILGVLQLNIDVLINETTEGIVNRLMPPVISYGDTLNITQRLKKELSWIRVAEDIEEINQVNGYVCILAAEISEIRDCIEKINNKNIYIFCVTDGCNPKLDIKNDIIAIKLVEPTPQTIKFHITASLLIKESVLSTQTADPIILPSGEARDNARRLISAIKDRKPICIKVDKQEEALSWYLSIFEKLPAKYRPKFCKRIEDDKEKEPYPFIVTDEPNLTEYRDCIILTTNHEAPKGFEIADMRQSRWSNTAHELKKYFASVRASLEAETFPYCKEETVLVDFVGLVENLKIKNSKQAGRLNANERLIKCIEDNKTLSLSNIIEEIELRVLIRLKEKTELIKEVVFASGIKEVTMHKKIERYKKRRKSGARN